MSENTAKEKVIIGIDVGGSTTKIVGFRKKSRELIAPMFVTATDPVTSAYGAFGKFTLANGLELEDISCVKMTGVGATHITKPIYGLRCLRVSEFTSIGLGGLYLSGLERAIVVSMGTGTAINYAKRIDERHADVEYLGGTGVGGGTLVGLSKKLLGLDTVEHIVSVCEGGHLENIDLRISDISPQSKYGDINEELTAANFGRVSDLATRSDIALGIVNMVGETVGMMAIFAARKYGIKDIVLTGNLACLDPFRRVFEGMNRSLDVNFVVPDDARYSTVIGATLCPDYDDFG